MRSGAAAQPSIHAATQPCQLRYPYLFGFSKTDITNTMN